MTDAIANAIRRKDVAATFGLFARHPTALRYETGAAELAILNNETQLLPLLFDARLSVDEIFNCARAALVQRNCDALQILLDTFDVNRVFKRAAWQRLIVRAARTHNVVALALLRRACRKQRLRLHDAVRAALAHRQFDVLALLLRFPRADVGDLLPVLHAAVTRNAVKLVRTLLLVVDTPALDAYDAWIELKYAASLGHDACVRAFLRARTPPDWPNASTSSPLYDAVVNNHTTVVRTLVAANANVNAHTPTNDRPIFDAIARGNQTIVRILVNANADVCTPSARNRTPLQYCAHFQKPHCSTIIQSALTPKKEK